MSSHMVNTNTLYPPPMEYFVDDE